MEMGLGEMLVLLMGCSLKVAISEVGREKGVD